ncbi:MAG: hypothetical protein P8103_07885 [Candidatus Thiodiazotropha sp.]
MKPITLAITGLTATLASTTVSAHIGDHHDLGLLQGLTHLLTEHAVPIAAITLIAGGLLIKRLLRA